MGFQERLSQGSLLGLVAFDAPGKGTIRILILTTQRLGQPIIIVVVSGTADFLICGAFAFAFKLSRGFFWCSWHVVVEQLI